jgi:hypothetical protein
LGLPVSKGTEVDRPRRGSFPSSTPLETAENDAERVLEFIFL